MKLIKSILFVAFCLVSIKVFAVPAVLSSPVISDVTDRSFSLIWTVSQKGNMIIELYSDMAATRPVTGFAVANYGFKAEASVFPTTKDELLVESIKDAMIGKGIARLVVTGLTPNTTYYLKYGSENASQELTLCPDSGATYCVDTQAALLSVRTEKKPHRDAAASDVLLNDVALLIDQNVETGDIVLVNIESSSYPISSVAGDVADLPYVLIDLNNSYSAITNSSQILRQGIVTTQGNASKAVNIVRYTGLSGSTSRLAVLDAMRGNGEPASVLGRSMGDCNADGLVNGYDNLLLSNYIAGTFSQQKDEDIFFHQYLCDLYAENGQYVKGQSIVIDQQDMNLHSGLIIGRENADNLPLIP